MSWRIGEGLPPFCRILSRPAHSPLNCQRTKKFWSARWDLNPQKAALEAATYASSGTGLKLEIVQELKGARLHQRSNLNPRSLQIDDIRLRTGSKCCCGSQNGLWLTE